MAPILHAPLQHSSFSLDASGVAGFFGGDEAISAMSTVHLFKGRRWVGWFNSPGSYTIGKCYGCLANSRWWDGLFPGPNHSPAKTFGLDGKKGPNYVGTCSGTRMRTTHLGHLFMDKCREREWKVVEVRGRRRTTPSTVSVVELGHIPSTEHVSIGPIDSALYALIPIFVSVTTCALCALVEDWWASSMILLGIVAGGVSCFVIGSGKVTLDWHNRPSPGVPPGDGFLTSTENSDIAVVLGREEVVNVLTKGRFKINLQGGPEYRLVGLAALILETQFFFQLLLIPQATLFGQIMFVASLAVSWVYTSYLSSKEKEKIQADILWGAFKKPQVRRYSLGTRGESATFTTLVLNPTDPEKVLAEFVPNDTRVWKKWRKTVSDGIKGGELRFGPADWNLNDLEKDEKQLYEGLLGSAEDAYHGYLGYLDDLKRAKEEEAKEKERQAPQRSMTQATSMSMSTLVSSGRTSMESMEKKIRKFTRSMSTLIPPRRPSESDLEKGEVSESDTETKQAYDSENSLVSS
ncbi:hypothetical protein CONPUDRAFT_158379 [Coniophora puteana RWD-64-598 SS2]|uniref:Uncharacterized protein n=1 Tax=Coniophora puteana (strain RWD-64-598) TaxID=741705 RepID=A0A5M3MBG9_CONPW|nr:uncharacterized protein CONPUDRAFT_158379 [Coniophora puteana RWD-64-598 SS2]EIW76356.1 hypothetical protein CONPUDRAFT_158379 [Coniophora puteana RWD-64-598 SS2]